MGEILQKIISIVLIVLFASIPTILVVTLIRIIVAIIKNLIKPGSVTQEDLKKICNIEINKPTMEYKKSQIKYKKKVLEDMEVFVDEEAVIQHIKDEDPEFDVDQFKKNVEDNFLLLHEAWSNRDNEKIKNIETKELYEQHKIQLETYKMSEEINIKEEVTINWVTLMSFEMSGKKEILTVRVHATMKDYIIHDKTFELERGDRGKKYTNIYILKLVRPVGNRNKDTAEIVCQNCGAKGKISSMGYCEYCGTLLTINEHSWLLSSIERRDIGDTI